MQTVTNSATGFTLGLYCMEHSLDQLVTNTENYKFSHCINLSTTQSYTFCTGSTCQQHKVTHFALVQPVNNTKLHILPLVQPVNNTKLHILPLVPHIGLFCMEHSLNNIECYQHNTECHRSAVIFTYRLHV